MKQSMVQERNNETACFIFETSLEHDSFFSISCFTHLLLFFRLLIIPCFPSLAFSLLSCLLIPYPFLRFGTDIAEEIDRTSMRGGENKTEGPGDHLVICVELCLLERRTSALWSRQLNYG